MKPQHCLSACSFALVLCACTPSWPDLDAAGEGEPFTVTLDPPAPPSAAARVVQLQLSPSAEHALLPAPAELMLFQGKLGKTSLNQLAEHAPSATLQARRLAASVLPHHGGLLLAPREPLIAGAHYTLAIGEPLWSFELQVAERDALPLLELVWPPDGQGAGDIAAVWCAPGPLALAEPVAIALQPGDRAARIVPKIGAVGGRHCVHLQLAEPAPVHEELLLPPALLRPDGTPLARFDPTPLSGSAEPAEPLSVPCPEGEQPLGPGCARIEDDRMWITSHEARLWSLSDGAGLDVVAAVEPGKPWLVQPLPPSSAVTLHIATIARDGARTEQSVTINTQPPMAHPILSEVLANPNGPEPEQEWVELYNDGLAAAQLDQYRLQDIGGDVWLPSAVLPPGGYAVLVNASFDESADYDPMIPPGALLLHLDALGKNGLNNQGEPLKLLDAQDTVVSRFPAEPKPQAGHSVSRMDPKAPADQLDAFEVTLPTPAAPPR